MDTLAGTDDAKVCSFGGGGFGQSPRPGKRDADNPTVDEVDDDLVPCDSDLLDARIGGVSHNARATLQE